MPDNDMYHSNIARLLSKIEYYDESLLEYQIANQLSENKYIDEIKKIQSLIVEK